MRQTGIPNPVAIYSNLRRGYSYNALFNAYDFILSQHMQRIRGKNISVYQRGSLVRIDNGISVAVVVHNAHALNSLILTFRTSVVLQTEKRNLAEITK